MNKYLVTLRARPYDAIGEFSPKSFQVKASDDGDARNKAIDQAHAERLETNTPIYVQNLGPA